MSSTAALFGADSLYGARPVKLLSGDLIFPQHCAPGSGTYTYTASRYIEVPFLIERAEAFAGVKFFNSGAGNNGDSVKVAIYKENEDGTRTLVKDFGAATLTGAAAIRTLASAWTPDEPGWYFMRSVADDAVAVYGMGSGGRFAAGPPEVWGFRPAPISMKFPYRGNSVFNVVGGHYINLGMYYAGTYASFPESTGPDCTDSIYSGLVSNTEPLPGIALYK
jgi:hypothetical protein